MMKPTWGQSKWLAALLIPTIVTLLMSGCPANQVPVISGLSAGYEVEINPGTSCQLQCIASDADADELSYTWTVDGGSISGTGATVSWTAPTEAGIYTVTVEVSDGKEGIATKELILNVLTPNQPPVIETLAPEWGRLKKGSNTPITCTATDLDGDELTYEWIAVDDAGNPAGNFSGEGSMVTWVAPNDYGTYTIAVTVTDGRGGEASTTTEIVVCSCGSAH